MASIALSSSPIADADRNTGALGKDKKLWATAQDFESVFLGSMFGEITSHLTGDGPLGGQGAGGDAWRSMLTDELGKSVAQSGGIGVATQVYSELIRLQGNAKGTPP
jgi:Rod binding domain-containing protein